MKTFAASNFGRICMALGAVGVVVLGYGIWHISRQSNPPAQTPTRPQALTSASCRECHPAEFKAWQSSHHALAERLTDAKIDRAAFEPVRVFKAGSKTNQARFHDGQFQILATGVNTNIVPYRVERVLGVEPVRQYLTALTNGRWQAQEDCYDTVSNQWFDVFGADDRQPGEWGQWTGRGMNWNSMCAECHNTRLQKNYDEAADSYRTTLDEMGVGCMGCHASMEKHVVWQQKHPGGKEKDPTLKPPAKEQIVDNCGSCHSRREDLTGNFAPGNSFFDEYQMQILDESDTWYADGQVHGEDYELASFLSSKMSARGVICLDCHDPHSAKTLLPGNNLCLRCHNGSYTNAPVINPLEHSHHKLASAGNECVACHMPVTVYMQRHARRDHGFTIPDPELTQELGIPNACNRCHTEKSVNWATDAAEKWYGKKMERHTRERARWLAAAQKGDENVKDHLVEMLSPERESFYWRAVAAGLLWRWTDNGGVKNALLTALKDVHPLVRERAVRSLEPAVDSGVEDVIAALRPMQEDKSRAVRLAAAWVLRDSIDVNSPAGSELQAMLKFNGDQPIGQYRLAQFALARHDSAEALAHLRKAAAWDPYSPPFRFERAEILGELGQTNEALAELQEVCRLQPQSAEGQFKLGVALADAGKIESAADAFKEATRLDPQNALAWYNLGLATSALSQIDNALFALDRAADLLPKDPNIPYARAQDLAKIARYTEARAAAQKALNLQPDFQPAQELLDALPPNQ